MNAKIYKNLKPKYIELYSKRPPTNAPNILQDKVFAVEPDFINSLEKASPENNTGRVKIIGTKIFNI